VPTHICFRKQNKQQNYMNRKQQILKHIKLHVNWTIQLDRQTQTDD